MEASVEVGEGVLTDDDPAASPPTNPSADAARQEYANLLSDPSHPHYEGYRRNAKAAHDYADNLCLRAYPSAPVEPKHLSVTTGGPDDPPPTLSEADTEAWQALQEKWGTDYACNMLDAQFGVSRITRVFGGEADDLISAVLAAVDELPPEIRSQVGGLKFVTNIARHFGKQARRYAP